MQHPQRQQAQAPLQQGRKTEESQFWLLARMIQARVLVRLMTELRRTMKHFEHTCTQPAMLPAQADANSCKLRAYALARNGSTAALSGLNGARIEHCGAT